MCFQVSTSLLASNKHINYSDIYILQTDDLTKYYEKDGGGDK